MNRHHGFDHLETGQFLKISGKFCGDGRFLAVEISIEPGGEESEIEAPLQALDLRNGKLYLCNLEIRLAEDVELKDLEQNAISWNELKPGDLVKVKGRYSKPLGFVPAKVKLREMREFNIEQIQGVIDRIDPVSRTLEVNGISVWVNGKTHIEDAV